MCGKKKGLSLMIDEEDQLKGEGAREQGRRSIDLSEIMNFSTSIDLMKESTGNQRGLHMSTTQSSKRPFCLFL